MECRIHVETAKGSALMVHESKLRLVHPIDDVPIFRMRPRAMPMSNGTEGREQDTCALHGGSPKRADLIKASQTRRDHLVSFERVGF